MVRPATGPQVSALTRFVRSGCWRSAYLTGSEYANICATVGVDAKADRREEADMTRKQTRNPQDLIWILDAEAAASACPTRRNRRRLQQARRAFARRVAPNFTE